MKNIVLFASGQGTNAENIIKKCRKNGQVNVVRIFCDKPHAGVYTVARDNNIEITFISKQMLYENNLVLHNLEIINPDLIVLAGFTALIPANIVTSFQNKIINIHPALLPKYGGKGMYGHFVHEKVKESGDKETGITIHYVNEKYDKGECIMQARCPIAHSDTPTDIARNVQKLEYACYPYVIFDLLKINVNPTD